VIRKDANRGILRRLDEIAPRDAVPSVVCVADSRARLWERTARDTLSHVKRSSARGGAEAVRACDLLAILEAQGEPIGKEDVWIGATALEHHLTVGDGI
jgi:predicted nucleic acid-binding protein